MKKFECNGCKNHCVVTTNDDCCPVICHLVYEDWHEVKEEACKVSMQDNGESIQDNKLPDWCKVGAIGHDNKLHEYFKITQIDNDAVMVKLIESSGYCSYHYFNEFCSEARKRPFNSKEMKNLAGSFATNCDGDVSMITDYDWFVERVKICGDWLCAEELMDSTWRIYNKPCYKLEHLENGEWVE